MIFNNYHLRAKIKQNAKKLHIRVCSLCVRLTLIFVTPLLLSFLTVIKNSVRDILGHLNAVYGHVYNWIKVNVTNNAADQRYSKNLPVTIITTKKNNHNLPSQVQS